LAGEFDGCLNVDVEADRGQSFGESSSSVDVERIVVVD